MFHIISFIIATLTKHKTPLIYKHDVSVHQHVDLPPNLVPHLKLEFCHFMFFNEVVLLVLEDDYSMNYAA